VPLAAAAVAVLLIGSWAAVAETPAGAETVASIHASLAPDRLGASTAFTFAFSVSGGLESVPPPLRTLVVHLPAGLRIDLRGVPACTRARLRARGASGCPKGSQVGRGRAVLEVHAGSQTIPENASLWAVRIAGRGGGPAFAILGVGYTPLNQRSVSTVTVVADRPPYGSKLVIAVPPIPTVVFEPDASFLSSSLTVGAGAGRRGGHSVAGAVIAPRHCPAGGFPFAADFGFSDGSALHASAVVSCPSR
jgi:hypothetical protein